MVEVFNTQYWLRECVFKEILFYIKKRIFLALFLLRFSSQSCYPRSEPKINTLSYLAGFCTYILIKMF